MWSQSIVDKILNISAKLFFSANEKFLYCLNNKESLQIRDLYKHL